MPWDVGLASFPLSVHGQGRPGSEQSPGSPVPRASEHLAGQVGELGLRRLDLVPQVLLALLADYARPLFKAAGIRN